MRAQTIIIDDDPVFAGYMIGLLEAAGVENIICIGDAQRTLAIEELDNFTRIVCDLNMPDMDGIAFIEHLAKKNWEGELLIVSGEAKSVVTAAERLAKLSGIKVAGSLRKPVKLSQLMDILAKSPQTINHTPQNDVTDRRKALIRQAIKERTVLPVYQPQLNFKTRRIDGFEALMRLELSDGSLANPGEFFHRLSVEDAEQLARKQIPLILQDFKTWTHNGDRKRCSINFTPSQIARGIILETLSKQCKDLKIDPAQIIIEVTEDEPLIGVADLISAMSRLRIAGFGLALDDFGSGHANIQELGWFPFSEIKTDLSFGQDMLTDRFALAAIEFAIKAARQLEVGLTVEGLESLEAASLAARIGADRGQGRAIAHPVLNKKAQRLAIAS